MGQAANHVNVYYLTAGEGKDSPDAAMFGALAKKSASAARIVDGGAPSHDLRDVSVTSHQRPSEADEADDAPRAPTSEADDAPRAPPSEADDALRAPTSEADDALRAPPSTAAARRAREAAVGGGEGEGAKARKLDFGGTSRFFGSGGGGGGGSSSSSGVSKEAPIELDDDEDEPPPRPAHGAEEEAKGALAEGSRAKVVGLSDGACNGVEVEVVRIEGVRRVVRFLEGERVGQEIRLKAANLREVV
jgi:hypothetical protein